MLVGRLSGIVNGLSGLKLVPKLSFLNSSARIFETGLFPLSKFTSASAVVIVVTGAVSLSMLKEGIGDRMIADSSAADWRFVLALG